MTNLLLYILCALVLVACGGGSGGTSNPTTSTTPPSDITNPPVSSSPGTLTASTDLTISRSWTNDQGSQTYQYPAAIAVPSIPALQNKQLPTVIILHGSGGNGAGSINLWQNVLDDHILIAPTGFNNRWNVASENTQSPDIDYLREIVSTLTTFDNVNDQQIKILGSSNGAGLTNRAIIELDSLAISDFVTLATQLFDPMYRNNTFYRPSGITGATATEYDTPKIPTTGRRITAIHGTNDNVIPYAGGFRPLFGYTFLHAQESVYALAQSQGFDGPILSDADGILDSANNTYAYSYLNDQVVHYKTPGAHGAEDYVKDIVKARLAYDHDTAPDA